jgi:hypothetical protein
MSSDAETKSMLTVQAEKMRAELLKAADKVKEIPQVKRALELYDEQMEKLRQAMVSRPLTFLNTAFFLLN